MLLADVAKNLEQTKANKMIYNLYTNYCVCLYSSS